MNTLTVVSLLLIGIISTYMIKQFIPKLPETFIFILVGIGLSFTPTFHHFELEPEFFMLVVIAPLMFLDGQQQSFAVIKKTLSDDFYPVCLVGGRFCDCRRFPL